MLVWGSKEVDARIVYPTEPSVGFVERNGGNNGGGFGNDLAGWTEMENPFLFASASWNGFSGEAWLRKPEWKMPDLMRPVRARYLAYEDADELMPFEPTTRNFALVDRRGPRAVFQAPEEPASERQRKSELKLEGFGSRKLATRIPLPELFHDDVLDDSVVEVLVGHDGLVISARVIDNSGSAKADAEALSLAKTARFMPSRNGGEYPATGKLIFDWFALNLGDTNNVKR